MKAVVFWVLFVLLCYGLLFACSDVLRLILFIVKKPIPHFQFYAGAVSIALCVLLLIYGTLHARSVHTANYTLTLPGSGGGIRIALVSDLQ